MMFWIRFYELLDLDIQEKPIIYILSLNQTTREFLVAYQKFIISNLISGRFKL